MTPEISMILVAIVGALTGALVGGGAAIVITDRIVKNVLNSPVLTENIRQLGASFPPEVRTLLVDSGKLLETVGGTASAVGISGSVATLQPISGATFGQVSPDTSAAATVKDGAVG